MNKPAILAIDQGTTSSRAMVLDGRLQIVALAQEEFPQIFPAQGWVEHDPDDIWKSTRRVADKALRAAQDKGFEVLAIGITNQRETTVLWHRSSGRAVANAIVWQDRRTSEQCLRRKAAGEEEGFHSRTGLLLDPYFSCTKLEWLLDNVDGAREMAAGGKLAFGTIDSWLAWKLTGGKAHVTDATNASRTGLFNIHTQAWDPALLEQFNIPEAILPRVHDCVAEFGITDKTVLGASLPIFGIAGDQQAAAIGQGCFNEGDIKSTYGTGCFVLVNTGDKALNSENRLLTTVASRFDGHTSYALEGSIFMAGAAVQWLRDSLGIIKSAPESETLAKSIDGNHGVYVVPAFTGLGAPHWRPDARAAVFGLTRASGRAELARATLEAVAYQTYDLLQAMIKDGVSATALRVDGGMAANGWLMQFLADLLQIKVERPQIMETTALGAAYLAGWRAGIYAPPSEFASGWKAQARFEPAMDAAHRLSLLQGWHAAVSRVLAAADEQAR
ncbi:MAG: glycerol kinase GlpK [Gammaproteobacteria bacterium]|nr:glycerol kinase GlpK [Gammaproteobacteria bacterium]